MSVHHTEKDGIRQLKLKRIRSLSTIANTPLSDTDGQFLIYKERGETLAVLVKRFRAMQGISETVPITYAGRLDPMAEGIVLLLVGSDRYKKDGLLGLTKMYEVEVLLGIATDTQDVLGIITDERFAQVETAQLTESVKRIPSIVELPYPGYSSVIVEGKPLFVHTRAGASVTIPTKKVTISEATLIHTRTVPVELIAREAIEDIGKVEGDFRQASIMKQWQTYTQTHRDKEVLLATVRVTASSGTYMRSLSAWLGAQLGVPALAYRIKRTKLGEYGL
jgi:tRNA pseudouridine55 synthase